MYQRNLIPTINKPTRVGKNSAMAIDHIVTDYVLTCDFKTAFSKTDLTDHFPIVIALKNHGPSQQHSKTKHKYKRSYNEENIKAFNQRLLSVNWDEVKNCDDPNEAYKPISVLSCFSNILERIMYNRLYQYLTENKILYPKQFGFQTGHSTEHAIV